MLLPKPIALLAVIYFYFVVCAATEVSYSSSTLKRSTTTSRKTRTAITDLKSTSLALLHTSPIVTSTNRSSSLSKTLSGTGYYSTRITSSSKTLLGTGGSSTRAPSSPRLLSRTGGHSATPTTPSKILAGTEESTSPSQSASRSSSTAWPKWTNTSNPTKQASTSFRMSSMILVTVTTSSQSLALSKSTSSKTSKASSMTRKTSSTSIPSTKTKITTSITQSTTTTSGSVRAPLSTAAAFSSFWYEEISHNGSSPFIDDGQWSVFRNVKAYGTVGNGVSDDAQAIQNAIDDAGGNGASRISNQFGTTGQPAVVYIPSGVYILSRPLQLYVGTVLMGNPISLPVLRARSGFIGGSIILAEDPNHSASNSVYISVKNLVLDSTKLSQYTSFTLMDWSVSQATQLTNMVFNMLPQSSGQIGLSMAKGGSGIVIGDLTFNGGAIGINIGSSQSTVSSISVKSVSFSGCSTAIKITSCFASVFQSVFFNQASIGIEMSSPGVGSVSLIDSAAKNVGVVVSTASSGLGDHSIAIDNFVSGSNVPLMVRVGGRPVLAGSVTETWIYGNSYLPGAHKTHQTGLKYPSDKSDALLTNGKYFTKPAPTYKEYDVSNFINVKGVLDLPVYGDGTTDDTENLNAIIQQFAGCKILFFPSGTYLVSDTLFFPSGSIVVGEAWSAISAIGSKFQDPTTPAVMVRVGIQGDVGVAQFSDILFTVADVLPGCILLEVNIAGSNPGDVGFWNCHFRVGGAFGSAVQTNCSTTPAQCMAAFLMLHLTASSSAYIENMWGFTADHDLDGDNVQVISTGRGVLVETQIATWLVGTSFEQNTLYQYNLNGAQNVYAGLQQSQSPYWQGTGFASLAPAPWTPDSRYGDPTFSSCSPLDAQCRIAWFQCISGAAGVFLYGSDFSASNIPCGSSTCQLNAVEILNSTILYYYNLNILSSLNLINNDSGPLATLTDNAGDKGGIIAAFLGIIEDGL